MLCFWFWCLCINRFVVSCFILAPVRNAGDEVGYGLCNWKRLKCFSSHIYIVIIFRLWASVLCFQCLKVIVTIVEVVEGCLCNWKSLNYFSSYIYMVIMFKLWASLLSFQFLKFLVIVAKGMEGCLLYSILSYWFLQVMLVKVLHRISSMCLLEKYVQKFSSKFSNNSSHYAKFTVLESIISDSSHILLSVFDR